MSLLVFLIFWAILLCARHELGWRGAVVAVAIWAGLFLGFAFTGISPYLFVTAECLLDIVLILIVFKGDIRIN